MSLIPVHYTHVGHSLTLQCYIPLERFLYIVGTRRTGNNLELLCNTGIVDIFHFFSYSLVLVLVRHDINMQAMKN